MRKDAGSIRYSQTEAAKELGLSVGQIRSLVQNHIAPDAEITEHTVFHASDLLVLRLLAAKTSPVPAA